MQSGFIKRIRDIMRMDAGINGDAQRIEQMVWMLFLKVYDSKEDDWEINEKGYKSIIPEDLRWRNWAQADDNGHAMTGDKLLDFVNNTLFPVLKGNDVKEGDKILYKGIVVTPDTPVKKAIVRSTFEDANNYMKDGVYLRQVIDVIDEIEFDDVKESHEFGFVYEEILRELQSAGSSGEFYTPRAVTDFMALMIKPQIGEKMADQACGTGGMLSTGYNFIKRYNPSADVRLFGQEINPESYAMCLAEMLIKGQNAENICYQDTMKADRFPDIKMRFVLENPPFGTAWGGKDAAEGVEKAVNDEYAKGYDGRWGAGLPGSGDMQMLFLQSAIDKMDDNFGRAAIIENGSPLFTGGTASGESQIRRWMLENDLIEAIIALPTDLFYIISNLYTVENSHGIRYELAA